MVLMALKRAPSRLQLELAKRAYDHDYHHSVELIPKKGDSTSLAKSQCDLENDELIVMLSPANSLRNTIHGKK
jgi:hypothetical protein